MAGTTFDTTKVRLGDLVAGASGVLLFISLFFHWYSVSVHIAGFSQSQGFSGWTVLSFIDILLFIIALIAVAIAVARMAGSLPRTTSFTPGLLLLGLGALATLLVLFRIIDILGGGDVSDIPGVDLGRSFGIFVALIASLGITAGGWIGWNEEGKPRVGGGRVGGAGTTPAGAGGPVGGPGQPGAFEQAPQTQVQPEATAPPATTMPEAAVPAAEPTPSPGPPPSPAPTPPQSVDAPPPGGAADWYPDPRGEKRLRYYDGTQWTHHTAD